MYSSAKPKRSKSLKWCVLLWQLFIHLVIILIIIFSMKTNFWLISTDASSPVYLQNIKHQAMTQQYAFCV